MRGGRHLTREEPSDRAGGLALLTGSLNRNEIPDRLEIASKTVATHIERIPGNLGVRGRAQAVAMAYRETLVTISA